MLDRLRYLAHPSAQFKQALAVLFFSLSLILFTNRYASQSLPGKLSARLDKLNAASMPAEAETVYRQLLAADPENIDLHVAYIRNHFNTADARRFSQAQPGVVDYYTRLAGEPASADTGNLGLGLIQALQKDYPAALEQYRAVKNTDLKYLNGLTGEAYLRLNNEARAEAYFQKELELGGDLANAVAQLGDLYFDQRRVDGLQALSDRPETAAYLRLVDWRHLAYLQGDLVAYLKVTALMPLGKIWNLPLLCALLIGVTWLFYFWRIDVFGRKSLALLALLVVLGAATALSSLVLSDVLGQNLPLSAGQGWFYSLLYFTVHVGMVEELVKLLPVLLVVVVFRQARQPFDLVLYGSLSALGFATLENALYFSVNGMGLVMFRYLFSTVLHMAATSLLCFAWAKLWSIRPSRQWVGLLAGYSLAILVHGLFDFFLNTTIGSLQMLSFAVLFIFTREYYRLLRNALNASPFFDPAQSSSPRLNNFGLLFSVTCILVMIVYLYYNFNFSTEIANQQLSNMALFAVPAVLGLFGCLGQLKLSQGEWVPFFSRRAVQPARID